MADVTLFALAVIILLVVIGNLRRGVLLAFWNKVKRVGSDPLPLVQPGGFTSSDDATLGNDPTMAPLAPFVLEVVSCRVPKGVPVGKTFPLIDGINSIGSAPTEEPGVHRIAIEGDKAISRDHLYIENKAGQFVAMDRQSRYGTRVNNQTLQGTQEVPLKLNDIIGAGNTTFRFKEMLVGGEDVGGGRGRVQPQAKFTVQNGPQKGHVWPLNQNQVRIGRAQDADWQLNDAKVSRHHAEIRREGELVRISDLGSSHGIFVNNHKYQTRSLEPGDVIKIGDTEIKYEMA